MHAGVIWRLPKTYSRIAVCGRSLNERALAMENGDGGTGIERDLSDDRCMIATRPTEVGHLLVNERLGPEKVMQLDLESLVLE